MTAVAQPSAHAAESPVAKDRPRRWGWLAPLLSILAGTTAIAVHAARYGNWIADDAAITFAYSRSLATGSWFSLQPGVQPVEGFSDPTWMVSLTIGRLLGLFDHGGTIFGVPDYVLFPKALALLCCAGILTACYLVAKRVTARPALLTLLVGLIIATIPSFVIWTTSGLENSMFALAVVTLAALLFIAVVDGRLLTTKVAVLAGLLVAFAGLTRPDGALYLAAYPVVLLAKVNRSTLVTSLRAFVISAVAFAVPYGGYLIFRVIEFGRLLPNPAVAKSQGLPIFEDLTRAGDLVQYAGVLAVLIGVLLIGRTLTFPSPLRGGLIALLVPLTLAIFAYSVMRADWMGEHRFATPIWPLAALACTLALADTVKGVGLRGRLALGVALLAAAVPSIFVLGHASTRFTKDPTIPACYVADRLGRSFNAYADIAGLEKASLLLPDLGGSSLTSRLTLIDMAGLTDKRIADFINAEDMVGLRDHVFDVAKPTFIHSRGPWGYGNGISSDPRLERDYVHIYRYPHPGPPGGDWIRRDALRSPQTLNKLRDYAQTTMVTIERDAYLWPLRQCSPMVIGDTTVNRH